jgi:hypothetical protein
MRQLRGFDDGVLKAQRWSTVLLLAVITLSACNVDKLLTVSAPSRVVPKDLYTPANATVIVNGAVADFECAFGGYTLMGGMAGEELHDASLASEWWPIDRRTMTTTESITGTAGCQDGGVYVPLSTARWQADNAVTVLKGWTDEEVPGRTSLLATASAMGGYSLVLLGEGMCSAAIDGGPELTPAQLFQMADDHFTEAIAAAQTAQNDSVLNLAYLGRARARLDLGKPADAAADAQKIPAGFVWNANFDSNDPLRYNQVYVRNVRSQAATVDTFYRAMTYAGVADPRVTIAFDPTRKASDGELPLYYETKYPTVSSPMPIARYTEAQLIIAEAAGGQTAVGIINTLHDAAHLPHFASTDPAAIQAQIIYERRAEFFLESQHLGDLIRYKLPLRPAAGTRYQTQKGGAYGTQLCFPLPDVETLNNPNITHS